MRDGWLGDRDVANLARQAVDLPYPPATVTVEALNRGGRWAIWGGLSMGPRCPRGVTVRIAPGNQTIVGINPDWTEAETLAHLIDALSGACHHRFRDAWYPLCLPEHDHPSTASATGRAGRLTCAIDGREVTRIHPDIDPT